MAKRRAEYQVQLELQRDQQKMAQKEQAAQEARQRDEESIARQEQLRRDTLEYEAQLKASLEQQSLQMKKQLDEENSSKAVAKFKDLMAEVEREKRESRKQMLMASTNTFSSLISQAFSNPKVVAKVAYMCAVVYGTIQLTKIGSALVLNKLLSNYSKPQLVR